MALPALGGLAAPIQKALPLSTLFATALDGLGSRAGNTLVAPWHRLMGLA
jgi:hypothetical protein